MTFAEAVRRARMERNMSQQALAQLVGATQSTINRLENGEAARSRVAPEVAAIFGIPFPYRGDEIVPPSAQLFTPSSRRTALQVAAQEGSFPIYAAAEGGRGTMVVSTDPIDHMPTPSVMKNVQDGFGVLVVGESMFPAYEPGDIALINPRLPFMRDTDVVFVSGETDGDFTASIKRLVNWDDDNWTAKQWNPAQGEPSEFALLRKTWQRALRVIGKYARR